MEIREITTLHKNAPFKGYGVWVVFETRLRKAHLFHPVTFTELFLSEYEFVRSCGNCLWPFNNSGSNFNVQKFYANFLERVEFFVKNKKSFPVNLVAQVISEVGELSMENSMKFIQNLYSKVLQQMPEETTEEQIQKELSFDKHTRVFKFKEGADTQKVKGRPLAIVEALKQDGPATMLEITERVSGTLKTKCKLSRTVTYFVNKLTSQGILEIVA